MANTAELIAELNQDLLDAYDVIEQKGGTVPEQKTTSNLAEAIGTVSGGITPRPPLPHYPYPVEEFDGGEYGAIAYLRNDEVRYYTATSNDDLRMWAAGAATTSWTVCTLDDGFAVTNTIVLAWAIGRQHNLSANANFMVNSSLLQAVYFPEENVSKSILSNFCYNCPNLNCPITIPDGITSIGAVFLSQCKTFNQPVTLPSTLTSLDNSFLSNCSAFNQPLYLLSY